MWVILCHCVLRVGWVEDPDRELMVPGENRIMVVMKIWAVNSEC